MFCHSRASQTNCHRDTVGKINAAWRVAMATVGKNFTKEEHAAGWPETLKHWQLAALQYPHVKGETAKIRLARARADDFLNACKSGDLPHTATTVTVTPKPQQVQRQTRFASSQWLMRDGFISVKPTQKTPQPYDVTTYTITASDFAAWLAAQPETQSEHIAAWCAALGLDGDTRPVVPPDSWAAQSSHGLQRCDGTADGRLVRLADVVTWLMQARELPCQNAVEVLCTALERLPASGNALYLLSENGYANVMPANHSFYYLPIVSLSENYPQGDDDDKGLAGALKHMRTFWGKSSAPGAGNWVGQHVLNPIAVRLSLAHRLWGYGRRGDEVVPEAAPAVTTPPTAVPVAKPVQRSAAQDAAVLAALKAMGIDPLAVPKNEVGKAGTKAEFRAALASNALFTGTTALTKHGNAFRHVAKL